MIAELSQFYAKEAARLIERARAEGDPRLQAVFRAVQPKLSKPKLDDLVAQLESQGAPSGEREQLFRTMMHAASLTTAPEPHAQYGAPYLPATSPLRSYAELVNQRQILHVLDPAKPDCSALAEEAVTASQGFDIIRTLKKADEELARTAMIATRAISGVATFEGILVSEVNKDGVRTNNRRVLVPELDYVYPLKQRPPGKSLIEKLSTRNGEKPAVDTPVEVTFEEKQRGGPRREFEITRVSKAGPSDNA